MKVRQLALLLALTLAASTIFSGCSSKTDSPNTDKGTSELASTTDDSGRKMRGNMYLEGLPLVKEQETFSILIDQDIVEGLGKFDMDIELEKQTNVKVEYQAYPYDAAIEKKNILINSGDYPDVIGGWLINSTEAMKYGPKENLFIPLEGMFDELGPRINEILDLPTVRSTMTLPDGHIYSFPYVIDEPKVFFTPWINQLWLDKVQMKNPTTTDELYGVLKAFKGKDLNGNGKEDEIPFGIIPDRLRLASAWFGYPEGLILIDGKATHTAVSPNYKEAIKFFAKLYKEGLMDPEVFTADKFGEKTKLPDDVYGTAIFYGPVADILNVEKGQHYVPLNPLTSPVSDKMHWNQSSSGNSIFRTQLLVTDKAKNPETIVRWVNNLYEVDNSIQAAYGPYGKGIEKTADNGYKVLEHGLVSYCPFVFSMPRYIPLEEKNKIVKSEVDAASKKQLNAMDELYKDNLAEFLPPVWLTAEESTSIATIRTDIDKYIRDKRAEWVSGQADVEKEWDAYVAQMDKLGLQKYIVVQGGALEKAAAAAAK
ncbi:MAG: extracellular solute-binding protein [Oscillospiraceae bacterium]